MFSLQSYVPSKQSFRGRERRRVAPAAFRVAGKEIRAGKARRGTTHRRPGREREVLQRNHEAFPNSSGRSRNCWQQLLKRQWRGGECPTAAIKSGASADSSATKRSRTVDHEDDPAKSPSNQAREARQLPERAGSLFFFFPWLDLPRKGVRAFAPPPQLNLGTADRTPIRQLASISSRFLPSGEDGLFQTGPRA